MAVGIRKPFGTTVSEPVVFPVGHVIPPRASFEDLSIASGEQYSLMSSRVRRALGVSVQKATTALKRS